MGLLEHILWNIYTYIIYISHIYIKVIYIVYINFVTQLQRNHIFEKDHYNKMKDFLKSIVFIYILHIC